MARIKVSGKTRTFDIDNPKLPTWVRDNAFTSGGYIYDKKLKRSDYEEALERLQLELIKLHHHQQETGKRVVIVFEGRDAAGKGGTINAISSFLPPRHTRTVALSKPTDVERGQWYFQRYVDHFPTSGEFIMFDRSWYNRAGVEPVMGFCSEEQHAHFLTQVPSFEKMLVEDDVAFFKFWLNVGQEMQLKRFHDRRHNPLKSWKLSSIDRKALTLWDEYTTARDTMLKATHTKHAPWTIVRTNDKRRGRLNAIRHVLLNTDYEGKDVEAIGKIDRKILGSGPKFFNTQGG